MSEPGHETQPAQGGAAAATPPPARFAAPFTLDERYYRPLLENAIDMMTIVDREGRILYKSRSIERYIGWRPEELIGKGGYEYLHPDDVADARRRVANVLAIRGRTERGTFRYRHKDGSYRTHESLYSSFVDEDGELRVIINARDISDRLEAEEALRKSEERIRQLQRIEALGRLAGGVAHDFNNHLTVILAFADHAARRLPKEHAAQDDLSEVVRAGGSAAALTRQLLAFSRKQPIAPRTLSLAEVVRSLQKMLRRLIGEDIELRIAVPERSPLVHADAAQLEQVVVNLAVNARDAMPEGGRVSIEVDEVALEAPDAGGPGALDAGSWARLRVEDTGTGMDAATLARLFEPFFTTKEAGHGTGLGLATTHGIVTQIGGAIRVRSAPGKGSTFDVYLPLALEAAADPALEPLAAWSSRGGETVLVVEDDDTVLTVLRDVLEAGRYRVVAARDGEEGMAAAARLAGRVHLVLTDVIMPRLSGPEMVARLARTHPEARVLYMSGYLGDSPAHRRLLESGAALLQKPFLPDDLLKRVREVLDAPRLASL